MDRVCAALACPAAPLALIASVAWAPVAGFPTWPALSRGRLSSTLAISVLVGWTAFVLVRRLAVAGGG
jgi:hypothetical protein